MVYLNFSDSIRSIGSDLILPTMPQLLRIKNGEPEGFRKRKVKSKSRQGLRLANLPFLIVVGLIIYGLYRYGQNNDPMVQRR